MTSVKLSDHAIQRFAQRALSAADAELIMELGTEVEGGYLMRTKDLREIEAAVKGFLVRMRRLDGKRIVADGNTIITGYHTSTKKQRQLLRT